MPNYWLFALTLVIIGVASQTFTTTANSVVQMSSGAVMRGRVMALFLAIALGGAPLGGPLVGGIADRFGPRWSLGVAAAAGGFAAVVGVHYLAKYRKLSLRLEVGRLRCRLD